VTVPKLRYVFVPIPDWIEREWEARQLSDQVERLHRVLYRRAKRDALAARRACVEISAETLGNVLSCNPEAARKLMQRERQRGHLDYRLRGSPKRGYVLVVTLYPDGPKPVAPESRRRATGESRRELGAKLRPERNREHGGGLRVPYAQTRERDAESRTKAVESRRERSAISRRKCARTQPQNERVPNVQNSSETLPYEGRTTNVGGEGSREDGSFPWSLDDLDPEVRDAVKRARRQRGEYADDDVPGEREFLRLLLTQFPGSELRDCGKDRAP